MVLLIIFGIDPTRTVIISSLLFIVFVFLCISESTARAVQLFTRNKVKAVEHSVGRFAAEARRTVGRLRYLKNADPRMTAAIKNPMNIGGIITFDNSIVEEIAVLRGIFIT